MVYSRQNNLDREFFQKDFSEVNTLLNRIRESFVSGKDVLLEGLNLGEIINYNSKLTYVYITLFQEGQTPIRWGSCRQTLEDTINRDIAQIKANKSYTNFDVGNSSKCRIMFEYLTEQVQTSIEKIKISTFNEERFEPGITGLRLNYEGKTYIYTPSEAWSNSQMDLKSALNTILRKTPIKNTTNKISERIDILRRSKYECFLVKSRCFITYKEDVLPLYRGNILWNYSQDVIKDKALAGADWIVKYQKDNGQYLYYYDAKDDNFVDHEHPNRAEDDLYYNDLRHCGGIITLIRAYQLTKDIKYLESAKRGLDFITTITEEHQVDGKPAAYVFYNKKAKLGGTGMILIAMMRYRIETGDKSYDEFIKKYTRHLLSRIHKTGEMLGYYIHPSYQDGNPLVDMTDNERRETFSFYYPGEALLGLALFANHFDGDDELLEEVLAKSEVALDWLVDERPNIYADLFTALPSDAWLMQAIEEWTKRTEFQKDNYINFVLNDAGTMITKTYQEDDSPYIDYEGSYYYYYGDHFYPYGSRSEGLIAAYYMAKNLGNVEVANSLLEACRKTAKSQMILANVPQNIYAHKNPEKSVGAIRFKATRQWVRVDSIQHVACFYFRLYFAENNIPVI